MRYRRVFHALLLSLFVAPAAYAAEWYEYTSENFAVVSDAPENPVNDLVRNLEHFRRAALFFTGLAGQAENRRLRVYLFENAEEFRQFSGDKNIAGFYRETWQGPRIFAHIDGHGISGSGLVFHEYVHHLMRQHSALTYPRWYAEGFAELLASAELRGDTVVFGGVPEWRLGAWLEEGSQPLTIVQLLNPDLANQSESYWNNYYASAWLFTHFLQLGLHTGEPDYRKATSNYLNAVAAGEDPRAVFKSYFGRPVSDMQRALARYMQTEFYQYHLEVPAYRFQISRRQLAENERLLRLAENAQAFGNLGLAQQYLSSGEPYAAGWLELQLSLAVLRAEQGDPALGKKIVPQVEDQGLLAPLTAAKVAHWYLLKANRSEARGRKDVATYDAAVRYAQLALQQNPAYLPAYRYLWLAYHFQGAPSQVLQTMLAAYEQDPQHLGLNSAIGFYLADMGEPEQARPYLERVLAWTHSAELRARAEHALGLMQ